MKFLFYVCFGIIYSILYKENDICKGKILIWLNNVTLEAAPYFGLYTWPHKTQFTIHNLNILPNTLKKERFRLETYVL